jgi:hypothetical protein
MLQLEDVVPAVKSLTALGLQGLNLIRDGHEHKT